MKRLNGVAVAESFYEEGRCNREITYGENGEIVADTYYDLQGNEIHT